MAVMGLVAMDWVDMDWGALDLVDTAMEVLEDLGAALVDTGVWVDWVDVAMEEDSVAMEAMEAMEVSAGMVLVVLGLLGAMELD